MSKYKFRKLINNGIESCDHIWVATVDTHTLLKDPPVRVKIRLCLECGRVEELQKLNSDSDSEISDCGYVEDTSMILKRWPNFLRNYMKFKDEWDMEDVLEKGIDNKDITDNTEEELKMKYFRYFKLRLLNRLPEVKTVGDDFILFNDGMSILFNFSEAVDKLNNNNYKNEIHKCILEINQLRATNMDDNTYRRINDVLTHELEGYYKAIKVYTTDEQNIIHIDLLDGNTFERKYMLDAFKFTNLMDAELNMICALIKSSSKKFENVVDDIKIENDDISLDHTNTPSNVIKMEYPENIVEEVVAPSVMIPELMPTDAEYNTSVTITSEDNS